MKKRKLLFSLLFMVLSVLAVGSSSQKAHAAEKTYKIGTDLTFAPFEYQDSDGKYIGIDVDLIKQIAKDQGFKVDLRPLGFDSSIQGVQSDQLDGMIAGMSITDERKKTFDFSTPYYDGGIQMAVKKGNDKIKEYSDLKGKTVAAKIGTESATFLAKNKAKYGYDVKQYEAADAMYSALTNDNVQAIFDDAPVLGYAVKNGQPFKLVGEAEKGSSYGFAVKKGENSDLLKKFNAGLKKLKANGEYDKIINKYISKGDETTSSAASGEMKKIEPKKATYTVVSDSAFAPFEYEDADGKYKGIDVDLLTKIAKMQGFNIEMKYIGFSPAMQALESGQGDGMIAGMTMTDERKANYDFSDPYFQSGIQLAVSKDNKDIKAYKDLKGKTVGAKVGTESADFLKAHEKEYGFKIKYFDAADQLYDALKVGSIDAMMDDYPVIGYAVKQGQDLKTPIKRESGGEYGFAVKKGENPELVQMFNEGLKELKRTGEYDKIVDKYISSNKASDSTTQKEDSVDESTIWGLLKNNYPQLLEGLWKTIVLALVSFVLALILGVIFGLFKVAPSAALRTIAGIYIDIIRGIPMMVLAFFIFFGLPGITGIKIPDFAAGIITLTLNASAYIAEIVRGGIQAVPTGQMEASRSLGLSYNKTMKKIILPQAVKIMIPSFINQFVISLKDTTIISAIGVVELLQTGKIIVARTTQSSYVYLIIAVMYLILITILTKLANRLDKKVN